MREVISASGIKNGIVVVFCPHTTAGITINENAAPDVVHDMLLGLARAYPDRTEFRHGEGNSMHRQEGRTPAGWLFAKRKVLNGTFEGYRHRFRRYSDYS